MISKARLNLPLNTHDLQCTYLSGVFSQRSGLLVYLELIETAIRQGKALGSLLYPIYTPDMPKNPHIHTSCADDIALLGLQGNF